MRILAINMLCFWLAWPLSVQAVTLFGQDLAQSQRAELRNAVKQAGAELLQEAGDGQFFDRYGSQSLLPGSDLLYLGFVKADQSFAFAEYEFHGFKHPDMVRKLEERYGKPQSGKKQFLSDTVLQWQQGEIEILWFIDWANFKARLQYRHAANLARLQQEQQSYRRQQQQLEDKQGANAY